MALKLSRTTAYAFLALGCLSHEKDQWLLSKDLADRTGIPGAYLARILHLLGRAGILQTKRGYHGGVRLAQPPEQINLLQIVEILEGRNWLADCILGLGSCREGSSHCPAHEFWSVKKESLLQELTRLTVTEVAQFARQMLEECSGCHQSLHRPTLTS